MKLKHNVVKYRNTNILKPIAEIYLLQRRYSVPDITVDRGRIG